ncbi:MAG TPA: SCP2 sterol-binding domain-containing protein [Anaerolineales bacterium]|nr:SCP2 sterol-binding domain-containing protein [Anaerolineales bacterium]
MNAVFPSEEWLKELETKLNSDQRYAEIARNWEGDLLFYIEPADNLKEQLTIYLDLWHGKCRAVKYNPQPESFTSPAFALTSTYKDITAILSGTLNPLTAMMTSKLRVQGSMGYMLRNIPTVLDFVRCAREVTAEII